MNWNINNKIDIKIYNNNKKNNKDIKKNNKDNKKNNKDNENNDNKIDPLLICYSNSSCSSCINKLCLDL